MNDKRIMENTRLDEEGQTGDGPVTVMITDWVRQERLADYERWLKGIHQDLQQISGFLSVDVIRHLDQAKPEYNILFKFDTQAHLDQWRASDTLAAWLKKVDRLIVRETHSQEAIGLELWFDRSAGDPQPLPPYWKRVVLSIGLVYPMILILSAALDPFIGHLPPQAAIFVVVVVLSALLTYPIMPYVSRWLQPWLYMK